MSGVIEEDFPFYPVIPSMLFSALGLVTSG